jgi:hypothetical protein
MDMQKSPPGSPDSIYIAARRRPFIPIASWPETGKTQVEQIDTNQAYS